MKSQRSFVAFANQRASSNTKRGMLSKNEMTLKERFVQFFRLPSLRVVFTLANAFILLLSVGVMILFTILRANSVKDNLSQTLSDSITQRATFYFTEILDSSLLTTYEASRFVSLDLSLTNNSDAMARYLLDILNRSPTVDQVFVGDHNGMFALAGRRLFLNSSFVSWVIKPLPEAQEGEKNRVQYFVNDGCSPLNLSCSIIDALMEESAYDPRVRGWYIEAATSNRSWTDVYFFAAYKDGGIAGYDPFFRGNDLIFVSAVGITLSRLRVFLDILFHELSELEAAFITSQHSEIIACSSIIPEDTKSCSFVVGTNYTSNSTVPDIVKASSIFDWNRILTNTSLEYHQEDSIIWAARAFQSQGLKWVMVVKISRKQIVGNSETLVFLVAPLVGVGLLILSLIITYWLTKRITVPLKRVTKKLLAVSNLEIDPAARIIETQSRIKEVNEIETATTTLIFGLRSFSKYVPQEIVKILLQLKREATLGLDEADISIFFSDIANFTTIAETISARELVSLLGEYLMEMSAIIQVSGGVVDKYIGDAVMAFWNAPNMVINHELVACEAAINSQVRLAELREAWRESGYPIIQARIGINSGKARVGNIGSSTRFNYTCIGDNVNLASRLEGLNKIYGTSIIVSGVVHDKVRKTYLTRLLDVVAVKGKSKAVRIYELIGKRADFPEERVESCNLFRKAFELYLSRNFEAAIKLFHQFNEQFPSDQACLRHLENCQKYLISPPPPNWDGVAKMEEK